MPLTAPPAGERGEDDGAREDQEHSADAEEARRRHAAADEVRRVGVQVGLHSSLALLSGECRSDGFRDRTSRAPVAL